ncbi:extracellular solute-binding protein [Paenibacillus nanensis]|uniref:Extracellular solute-binding protein n=1 Tax=Paenibacillus nanensis TaxID=393251 RepID=A0A3A1UN06_9BACL|nr:extracellular solute-binding protein [Paenibacillus nanensis]RIX49255.1 extracellular solute-binding protein [Paenibacillus nanensis]
MKRDQSRLRKSLALLVMSSVLLLSACSGGNGNTEGSKESAPPQSAQPSDSGQTPEEEPYKISIMMQSFDTNLPGADSPVIKQLEEYTNTDLDIQFVPNSSYPDKVNITLASGQLPTIMVVDKSPSFISAARAGAFWEVGPYLKDYPNLSMANDIVLNNSSIDGKNYGVYRGRVLGRMGLTLNQVWMDNLGLQPPKTIDEFYNILKAFKEKDPDQDGKDDTYGIVVTKYAGPWDIMQVWFGAPNGWGDDGSGNLVPTHMTPEYREALKFFRKLYEEGLVNEDFAVMDSAVWNDPFVNGEAGAFVDVADNARRLNASMQEKEPRDESYTSVYQAPVGPKGHRDMPTTGYAGMLAISKSAVKTEEELKKVLAFIDKLGDVEMQLLLGYGVEGTHYDMVDGYIVPKENLEPAVLQQYNGLNQMLPFIGPVAPTLEQTPINNMIAEVQAANEKIVVANPAQPLVSEVYAQKGQQLDNIIADARIQYIVGQIDDAGLDAAIKLWRETGGDDYIEEINKLYKESQQ